MGPATGGVPTKEERKAGDVVVVVTAEPGQGDTGKRITSSSSSSSPSNPGPPP